MRFLISKPVKLKLGFLALVLYRAICQDHAYNVAILKLLFVLQLQLFELIKNFLYLVVEKEHTWDKDKFFLYNEGVFC